MWLCVLLFCSLFSLVMYVYCFSFNSGNRICSSSWYFQSCGFWKLRRLYHVQCYRRMLGRSYIEHKTNEYLWQQVNILVGRQELLLSTVASYHGSTISVVMIRRRDHATRNSEWMVGVAEKDRVNHERSTNHDISECLARDWMSEWCYCDLAIFRLKDKTALWNFANILIGEMQVIPLAIVVGISKFWNVPPEFCIKKTIFTLWLFCNWRCVTAVTYVHVYELVMFMQIGSFKQEI